jgi:hypothetical protein
LNPAAEPITEITMPDLKPIPIVPKRYPIKLTEQQFRKEFEIRIWQLEKGLSDLKSLVEEYLNADKF